jgi:hypothetical protein
MDAGERQGLDLALGCAAIILDRQLRIAGVAVVATFSQRIQRFLGRLVVGGRDGDGLVLLITLGRHAVDFAQNATYLFDAALTAKVDTFQLYLRLGPRRRGQRQHAKQA